MDIKTGLSIYNKPWLIEPNAGLRLLEYWEKATTGTGNFNMPFLKSNLQEDPEDDSRKIFERLNAFAGVSFAPTNKWDFREFKGFEGSRTAVIPLTGPLMKADFCGEFGTASLRNVLRMAYNTRSVETVILFGDTPGGTVDGTQAFADEVKKASQLKNVITYCDGMLCSAGYWIGSSSDRIVTGEDTAIIGSIGTMISFYDRSKYNEENGFVLREYTATASKDKNKIFRDAEKGDGKLLVKEFLDPVNDIFLTNVKNNRSLVNASVEDVLTGKVYHTQEAIKYGLIDEKNDFDSTLNIAMEMAPKKKKKTYAMSTTKNNAAFQNVLIAAKAESFEVVEGGFLLTEAHLNDVDATIAEQKTTIRTLTQANETLTANAAAATTAAADLAAVQAELATSKEKAAELEAANTKLAADLQAAADAKNLFTGDPGAKQDKGGAHEATADEATKMVTEAPHVLEANKMLNIKD